jgi:hypothetical protein
MSIPGIGIEWTSEDIEKLDGLIHQISLRKCCAFIGAGLSHDAGYPRWGDIVSQLKISAEVATGREIDLPPDPNWDQIEKLRTLMGEELYLSQLQIVFGPDGKLTYLPVHHAIVNTPFIAFVTTNYDYCLENAASAASKQVTVEYYPELDITHLRDGHIFHIHGVITPDNPQALIGSVVLSKSDYERAYQQGTGLPRFLASLSEFYTLVFFGYSLGDSVLVKVIQTTQLELELRSQIEHRVGMGNRIQPKHYIVMHHRANVNPDAISDLGLIPIYYGGDQERHSALQRLAEHIRARTTNIHYPEPIVYRDMFEDQGDD